MPQHLGEVVKLLAINYYKNNNSTQQEVANILKYAYRKKVVRKTVLKKSTRRKKPKLYKK